MADNSRTRLGKGLGALLGDYLDEPVPEGSSVADLPVDDIRPNPFQPRKQFEPAALAELQQSIQQNGLLQPLVVRRAGAGWEIVAGERRFKAIQRLGWTTTPAIVRDMTDEQMLVSALVENLQRESLGALEEALAFQQLIDGFGFTQKQVSERLGKKRSTIANSLRLLALPEPVRELLAAEKISAGHARAILSVEGEGEQIALARQIVAQGLSVREVESLVKRMKLSGLRGAAGRKERKERRDPVARRAATLLARELGTRVSVRLRTATSGEIRIEFHDSTDFERLVTLIVPDAGAELFS